MARRHYRQEEILTKLTEADILISQGKLVAEVIKILGIIDVTYYRWWNEFGVMKSSQLKKLKELEKENARLRKAVSDLTLDKMILQEAAGENKLGRKTWTPKFDPTSLNMMLSAEIEFVER